MAKRKSFLLRMPPELLDAWRRVAAAELRSLNAQIELELRQALSRRGIRLGESDPAQDPSGGPEPAEGA